MNKPKYRSDEVEKFSLICQDYISKHDIFVNPPTIIGLQNALGLTKQNLYTYKKNGDFKELYAIYRKHFNIIQEQLTTLLISKEFSNTGLITYFNNVFGFNRNNENDNNKLSITIDTSNKSPITLIKKAD